MSATTTARSSSAAATNPLELLDFDSLLDEDERSIRDTVRRFSDERLRPHVAA